MCLCSENVRKCGTFIKFMLHSKEIFSFLIIGISGMVFSTDSSSIGVGTMRPSPFKETVVYTSSRKQIIISA